MTDRRAWGIGLATLTDEDQTLDVWFPTPALGAPPEDRPVAVAVSEAPGFVLAGVHRGRAAGGVVDLVRSVRGGVYRASAPGAAAGGQGSTGACVRGGHASADERLRGPARGAYRLCGPYPAG